VPDDPVDERVLEALRALQKKGRPDFPAMIVGLYLETAPSVLKQLETAAQVGDIGLLHSESHSLNSASALVGALRLSTYCNELEAIARTGSAPDSIERVQGIAE